MATALRGHDTSSSHHNGIPNLKLTPDIGPVSSESKPVPSPMVSFTLRETWPQSPGHGTETWEPHFPSRARRVAKPHVAVSPEQLGREFVQVLLPVDPGVATFGLLEMVGRRSL